MFARSELRAQVIEAAIIPGHYDEKRKAVKTWVRCAICGEPEAKSYAIVDHRTPVIPLDKTLEDLTWDQLIDSLWCSIKNLDCVCNVCHSEKTGRERKLRAAFKRSRKA